MQSKVNSPLLFPGRNLQAGTDQRFDAMLELAFQQPAAGPRKSDTTLSIREFARAHGWPLPEPKRFKWRRCLLVIWILSKLGAWY
jgi:hypothetical protein